MPASPAHYRPGLFYLSLLTACAVFPLLFVGATVTSTDSGMVYPEGIYSDDHFWNPPGWWEQLGTRVEHGHRLIGRAVGVLAIAVAILAWPRGGTVRTVALFSLAAIMTQGLLGIFRVDQISRALAMVHGIFGQVCFGLAAATALIASRSWIADKGRYAVPAAMTLQRLCLALSGTLMLQLITGAWVRHFPSDGAAFVHILLAVVVALVVGWVVLWIVGQHPVGTLPGLLAATLGCLMAVQLMLGGLTLLIVLLNAPWQGAATWLIPTAHVAVGALLLTDSVLLTLTCRRMLTPLDSVQSPAALVAN